MSLERRLNVARSIIIDGKTHFLVRAVGEGSCAQSFLARPFDALRRTPDENPEMGRVVKSLGEKNGSRHRLASRSFDVMKKTNGVLDNVVSPYHDEELLKKHAIAVTRFVPGIPMHRWTDEIALKVTLSRAEQLSQAIERIRQLVAALGLLIENRVVHLDIKPSNLIVMHEREGITIIDLDGMQFIDDAPWRNKDNEINVFGTPCAISPEVVMGKGPTLSSDMHGVGFVIGDILRRLTGLKLFPEFPTALEALRAKASGEFFGKQRAAEAQIVHKYVSPDEKVQQRVRALIALAAQALEHKPEARPQNAREANQILDYHLNATM